MLIRPRIGIDLRGGLLSIDDHLFILGAFRFA